MQEAAREGEKLYTARVKIVRMRASEKGPCVYDPDDVRECKNAM